MTANAQCLFCHTTDYDKGYQAAERHVRHPLGRDGRRLRSLSRSRARRTSPRAQRAAARIRGRARPRSCCSPPAAAATAGASSARRGRRATSFLDAFEPELFDTDAYYPDGQVHEELYELVSFQSSRMYAEGVRCWNCHDGHADGTLKPGNELCRTCHDQHYEDETHTHHPAGSAGAQCIALSHAGHGLHAARSASRPLLQASRPRADRGAGRAERLQSVSHRS